LTMVLRPCSKNYLVILVTQALAMLVAALMNSQNSCLMWL
jgi:hypothetical protein